MILKVKKNYQDSKIPTRANESDAGLDVYAYSMKIVGETLDGFTNLYKRIDYIEYDCGISIQPISFTSNLRERHDYFTYLAPRSSISKTNLIQSNSYGLIDSGYTGSLMIRYKYIPQAQDFVFLNPEKWPNFGIEIDENRIYKIGDKIAQLIVTMQHSVSIAEYLSLDETERGNGGFGSSGS
jgi:dUTP pyrophosphatase